MLELIVQDADNRVPKKPLVSPEQKKAILAGYEREPCPCCKKLTLVRSGDVARCDTCLWANDAYRRKSQQQFQQQQAALEAWLETTKAEKKESP